MTEESNQVTFADKATRLLRLDKYLKNSFEDAISVGGGLR